MAIRKVIRNISHIFQHGRNILKSAIPDPASFLFSSMRAPTQFRMRNSAIRPLAAFLSRNGGICHPTVTTRAGTLLLLTATSNIGSGRFRKKLPKWACRFRPQNLCPRLSQSVKRQYQNQCENCIALAEPSHRNLWFHSRLLHFPAGPLPHPRIILFIVPVTS